MQLESTHQHFDTDNDGIIITGRIQQIGSTDPNVFQATIHAAGGIKITSSGQTIDVNNGYIENLNMRTVPENKDAANVEFVRSRNILSFIFGIPRQSLSNWDNIFKQNKSK